ncbi:MAG: DUF2066 domain-containing protein [Alphaproteobacteria bacterium]|nr:DUF2066 domain-containing protein [Alphaproteobacteria bacterium]
MKRLSAVFLFLGMFLFSLTAKASPLFSVKNLFVDVTAESALAARENALVKVQIEAFSSLLKRIALLPEAFDFTSISTENIIDMVQNLSVLDEKNSKVRYLAHVSVEFKEDKVKEFLQEKELSFVPVASSPILVLPLYSDKKFPEKMLFSEQNEWFSSWKNESLESPLTPLILPLGDLEDMSLLSSEQLKTDYDIDIQPLLKKYGAKEALVFEAYYEENLHLAYFHIYPFKHVKSDFKEFTFSESVNEPLAAVFKRASKKIITALGDDYRKNNALRFDMPSRLTVVTPLENLKSLIQIRKKIESVKVIKKYVLQAVKKDKAQMEIFYAGNLKMLSDSLKKKGLLLFTLTDELWEIKQLEKATEEEKQKDPFLEKDTVDVLDESPMDYYPTLPTALSPETEQPSDIQENPEALSFPPYLEEKGEEND